MSATIEKWEYLCTQLKAEITDRQLAKQHGKHHPMALHRDLDRLGAKGWEMIHIEPVVLGRNRDVSFYPSQGNTWGRWYFCVFKRRKA